MNFLSTDREQNTNRIKEWQKSAKQQGLSLGRKMIGQGRSWFVVSSRHEREKYKHRPGRFVQKSLKICSKYLGLEEDSESYVIGEMRCQKKKF